MYELAIIGAGPAGMSASIYASRYKISNIVIGEPGGLAAKTHEIGNYLGFEKITGFEFAQKSEAHVRSYGAEVEYALVRAIEKIEGGFKAVLNNDKIVEAKNILIAVGTEHRLLCIDNELEYSGKGLSYCATCDGYFYKGKTVAVVGGGNSAFSAANMMAGIADKVYLIHRRDQFTAEGIWIDAAKKNPKIEIISSANVKAAKGEGKVEAIDLEINGSISELKVDGIFIEIGFAPNVELFKPLGIALTESGFIIVDEGMKTNVPGVWAAGDITTGSNGFRQIITAAAEGAIAIASIMKSRV